MNLIHKIKRIIEAAGVPRPGIFSLYLTTIQLFYFVLFLIERIPGYSLTAAEIAVMIYSFITLLVFSLLIESIPWNRLRVILSFTAIVIVCALYSYHLSVQFPLDYALVSGNMGLAFSTESATVMLSVFRTRDIIIFSIVILVIIAAEVRLGLLTRSSENRNPFGFIVSFVLWIIIIFLPISTNDEFTLFAKGAFASSPASGESFKQSADTYLKKEIFNSGMRRTLPSNRRSKPHVFIIMVESFNANFVEARNENGAEYTPYFNSLLKKGLYFDRFYGNSVQTAKGQAATFFSIIPSTNGKIFVDYPDLSIEGFPAILGRDGYETIFFQAYHNLSFDNTRNNMKKAGFNIVKSYNEFKTKSDKPFIWGWGVEDKILYERFFSYLDTLHNTNRDKPIFAAISTVSTHIPCEGMPREKMAIYENPKNIRERYANALHLADSQLPRFFELLRERGYLENSIVIITSDHSFPMREHGIYNNEICFYDETFRIPFLVLWDGAVQPGRIRNRAYSQIDIGPTIADMIGIHHADNTLRGTSVFARTEPNPVYLVQPYNGIFLQTVQYPLKYIFHARSGKEYLFDLQNDPAEKKNLINEIESAKIDKMRKSLDAVYLNQKLIETNAVGKKL